ncbi:MAG: circularly permuted type 2 ATP-grasp protein [Anaerolinea sp.]|nr:circularly permuted type 2 ATP-grasp protein [Anaerolinea sp.]
MLLGAIDHYHSLLDDSSAEEADYVMRRKLLERTLYFGERPICTVLRPHFYFAEQWAYLKHETEILLSAFRRAHEACLEDADMRQQLALEAYEEQLFSLDIGGVVPWTSSRLDSFFRADKRELHYVEYNAETPAGMGYNDILAEVFMELEPMKRFQQHYHVENMTLLGDLMSSLVLGYHEWGGIGVPQIGIVDWHDVPTLNEHEIIRAYFAHHGISAILVDPRDLEYRNGKLWARDFRIDLIYKRVLYSELVHRMGMDNAIIKAICDHAVMITNSPSAKMMAKKASFAFISDEQNAHLFTAVQQKAIHAHIPWTRLVRERKTIYQGREVDLLPFLADNQERFVLKPNDEYGGKGVILGWQTSPEAWQQELKHALTEPYVAQERVDSIIRDFPSVIDGKLDISPRFVDANPYAFNGRTVYGCLTRLSSMALLNVTAGGGSVVPTFLLHRK